MIIKKTIIIALTIFLFFANAEKRSMQNKETRIAIGVRTITIFVTEVGLVENKTQRTGQNLIKSTWKVL